MGLGRKALVPCLSVPHFGTLRLGSAEPRTAQASLPSRPVHCPGLGAWQAVSSRGGARTRPGPDTLTYWDLLGFNPLHPWDCLSGSSTSKLEVVLQKATRSSGSRPLGLSRVRTPAWSKSLSPDSTDFRIWGPSTGGLEPFIFPLPTLTSIHLISGLFL